MRSTQRSLLLAAALLLALSGVPAVAQTTPPPDWKERFQAHDKKGDGHLDRAEFQEWMVEVFYHHDKGHKGYLTLEDIPGVMAPDAFRGANRKGDGKLSLAEFLNTAFRDFEAADVDKDGTLTFEELDNYIRARRSGQ